MGRLFGPCFNYISKLWKIFGIEHFKKSIVSQSGSSGPLCGYKTVFPCFKLSIRFGYSQTQTIIRIILDGTVDRHTAIIEIQSIFLICLEFLTRYVVIHDCVNILESENRLEWPQEDDLTIALQSLYLKTAVKLFIIPLQFKHDISKFPTSYFNIIAKS